MNRVPLHIVFAGGGTGGHLFPGLAVAERLRVHSPQVRITFVGSGKPIERALTTQAGFAYREIACRPLPRRPWKLPSFVAWNLAGYWSARRILRSEPACVVVGLGGYASVPMARAAIASGIPLVLLEQNVVPGRATRWLASSARAVCTAFAQTTTFLPRSCVVHVTGTPIRPIVPHLDSQRGATRRLLVLGGSGGAHALNENVPLALNRIRSRLSDWQIVHQSGQSEQAATHQRYRALGLDATVVGFVDDLPETLATADLVICRSGGSTLAELAAAGVPAILLPYPHAADDHQRANADHFTAAGGCLTLDDRHLSGPLDLCLAEMVFDLVTDGALRCRMAAAMRSLARPDAAVRVADVLWTMVARDVTRARVVAGGSAARRQEKRAAA